MRLTHSHTKKSHLKINARFGAVQDNIKNISAIELLTDAEVFTFRKVFSMLDLDGGGTIEEEELRIGLER